MFQNKRYITRGVMAEIPLPLQVFMWEKIRAMPSPRDWLQVFKLSEQDGFQKVTHTQEIPEYQRHYLLKTKKTVTEKVFVIDDQTHTTMLLASEY